MITYPAPKQRLREALAKKFTRLSDNKKPLENFSKGFKVLRSSSLLGMSVEHDGDPVYQLDQVVSGYSTTENAKSNCRKSAHAIPLVLTQRKAGKPDYKQNKKDAAINSACNKNGSNSQFHHFSFSCTVDCLDVSSGMHRT